MIYPWKGTSSPILTTYFTIQSTWCMVFLMKLKVILPAVTKPGTPVPPVGLGTLMASLQATDEMVVTAEQAQQPAMWEDADVVIVCIGSEPERSLNLAELYRTAGTHVVLIGAGLQVFADSMKQRQTVFVGAADELWPAFLRDLRAGAPGHCYAGEFSLGGGLLYGNSQRSAIA